MAGAFFETWVVSGIVKSGWHNGRKAPIFYYRDRNGRETECVNEIETFQTPGIGLHHQNPQVEPSAMIKAVLDTVQIY